MFNNMVNYDNNKITDVKHFPTTLKGNNSIDIAVTASEKNTLWFFITIKLA